MTNVTTVQLSHTISQTVFTWLGHSESHHSLSHAAPADTVNLGMFVETERWYAEQFAYLLNLLLSLPDPFTGAPLLDDTLVLWVKELGDGRIHTCVDVPWVLAGSAGGYFHRSTSISQTHDGVLTSIAQAFGLELETFGTGDSGPVGTFDETANCALTWLLACDRPESDTPTVDADTAPSTDTASEPDNDIGCDEDVDVFTQHVWEPVLGKYCVSCHVADGQAGYTQMVLDPNDMLESLRQTTQVADLLLLKPTDLHENGHFGGELVLPDTEAWEALAFWVDWTHGICDTPATQCEDEPLPRRLWRLDHDQYKKTITDLLGISTDLTKFFATDTHVDGYSNDAASLRVSGLLADHSEKRPKHLAEPQMLCPYWIAHPKKAWRLNVPPRDESFGLKAFRRPLTEDDLHLSGLVGKHRRRIWIL